VLHKVSAGLKRFAAVLQNNSAGLQKTPAVLQRAAAVLQNVIEGLQRFKAALSRAFAVGRLAVPVTGVDNSSPR